MIMVLFIAILTAKDRRSHLGTEVIGIIPVSKTEKNRLAWKSYGWILAPLIKTKSKYNKNFTYVFCARWVLVLVIFYVLVNGIMT